MCFFFFKQKTAYEVRISDWSSDVCSSDPGRRVAPFMAWQDTEYWWVAKQAHDRWNMVSYGAEIVGQARLADLASRIACAFDECQTHLLNLCKAYAHHLGEQYGDNWALSSRCLARQDVWYGTSVTDS